MLCEDGDLSDLKRKGLAAEMKWDGTRVLIIKENETIRLQNRHGVSYTVRLPEIVQAARKIPAKEFKIDGEAVFINSNGEVEFTPCQRRCATHFPGPMLRLQYPLVHKGFDIMELNGEDLTDTPYNERKAILRDLLKGSETIQNVPYRIDLEKVFQEVVQRQEEGLVLKRLESRYEPRRSYSWLKLKNWRHEVCDVIGFTPGTNTRSIYFGALVLVKDDGKFRGCVGSGFSDWELRTIKEKLDESEKMEKPFEIGQNWTAVKSDLKVKVKYYKITKAGVMRFPVFEDEA